MNSPLNRSAEWPRLSQTRFFEIEDTPGQIVLSQARWPFYLALAIVVAVALGFLWLAMVLGWIGQLIALFIGLPLTLYLGTILFHFHGYAWTVRFTPATVDAFSVFGRPMGFLDRDSVQQIALKKDQREHHYHRFIADNGWFSAFPDPVEANALLKNNILMAAFAQPLHLDLTGPGYDAEESANVMPELSLSPVARP